MGCVAPGEEEEECIGHEIRDTSLQNIYRHVRQSCQVTTCSNQDGLFCILFVVYLTMLLFKSVNANIVSNV